MKKTIKIIAAFAVIAIMCSCSKQAENNTTSITNETSTSQTTSERESSTNVADTTVEVTELGRQNFSTEKVIWGPGNIKDHKRPTDPVSLQNQYGNLGASFIMNDEKKICLTFDEGYENGYTPSILDTLKAKNIKAIFFVTYDFAKDNPKLIERMIKEGHALGNHTYRHLTMDEIDEEKAREEIGYLDTYIMTTYNYKMTYFRFPKGEFSENTLALAKSMGYKSVFWSFAYADWDVDNAADPDEALKNITDSTHNGAIYLLHAVSKTNAEILPDAIDNIKKQGYNFTITL